MFLEGLKSSVDVFFRAQAAPHPLQFLRSVSLQPRPEVPTGWGGPDQARPVIPSPWRVACGGTELALGGRRFPGAAASTESPWLFSWARGCMADPKAAESIICWDYGRTLCFFQPWLRALAHTFILFLARYRAQRSMARGPAPCICK